MNRQGRSRAGAYMHSILPCPSRQDCALIAPNASVTPAALLSYPHRPYRKVSNTSGSHPAWREWFGLTRPQEVSGIGSTSALTVLADSSLEASSTRCWYHRIRLRDFKMLVNIVPPFLCPLKGKDKNDSMISSSLSQSSFPLPLKRGRRRSNG